MVGSVLYNQHQGMIDFNSEQSILAAAKKVSDGFVLAEVVRVFPFPQGTSLLVRSIGSSTSYIVSVKQIRLVERNGKKLEGKPAKFLCYILSTDYHDNAIEFREYPTIERAVNFVNQRLRDWNYDGDGGALGDGCEWAIYKGINISDEVDAQVEE